MTTPLEHLDLRNEIVRLKVKRNSDTEISSKVGVSVGVVKSIVKAEFTARLATRSEFVSGHKLELDEIRRLVWERVTAKEKAWDRKDLELLLRLQESERKLFGLDAPTKVDVRHVDELSDEELAAECKLVGIETGLALPPKRETDQVPDAEIVTKG